GTGSGSDLVHSQTVINHPTKSLPLPVPYQRERMNYPIAKKVDQVDDYHGTKVADPYRWLEDPDAADTRAWVEAENNVTFDFLNQIPERARIKERLTKLWNFERYDIPFREANRYFYFKNDGLQNQNVLYTLRSFDGEARVLLDPNKLSA